VNPAQQKAVELLVALVVIEVNLLARTLAELGHVLSGLPRL
jgi:hypothetical protein